MAANTVAQISLRPEDAVVASMDADVPIMRSASRLPYCENETTSTSRISEPNTQPAMRL